MKEVEKCTIYDGKSCDGRLKDNCLLCVMVLMEKHMYKIMKLVGEKEENSSAKTKKKQI